MRYLVLALNLFLFIPAVQAQNSFVVVPSDTLEIEAPDLALSVYDIWQVNQTNQDLILAWEPVKIEIPKGWDYSMCDKGTCYPGIPGGEMDPVAPGDSAFLGFNVNPNNVAGTAVVRCFVYVKGNKADGDTVTWIVHAKGTTGVEDVGSRFTSTQFYPNPARSQLVLVQELSSAGIYNLQGRLVRELGPGKLHSVQGLGAGKYLLIGLDSSGRKMQHGLIVE